VFAPLYSPTVENITNQKGEPVSSFGSGGLFLCYVITMLFLTLVFGWPALVVLILVTIGYAALLGELNDRFYPSGKARRQSRRKKRWNAI
jgi:hypothetical protein